jgi:hypothetical protein
LVRSHHLTLITTGMNAASMRYLNGVAASLGIPVTIVCPKQTLNFNHELRKALCHSTILITPIATIPTIALDLYEFTIQPNHLIMTYDAISELHNIEFISNRRWHIGGDLLFSFFFGDLLNLILTHQGLAAQNMSHRADRPQLEKSVPIGWGASGTEITMAGQFLSHTSKNWNLQAHQAAIPWLGVIDDAVKSLEPLTSSKTTAQFDGEFVSLTMSLEIDESQRCHIDRLHALTLLRSHIPAWQELKGGILCATEFHDATKHLVTISIKFAVVGIHCTKPALVLLATSHPSDHMTMMEESA